MAKLALVYGMRLFPVEDLQEVREATACSRTAAPLASPCTYWKEKWRTCGGNSSTASAPFSTSIPRFSLSPFLPASRQRPTESPAGNHACGNTPVVGSGSK